MSKVAGAFGWWRVAARVALGAAVLLAPALTRARDLAPTGDLAEGFDQDPSATGAWQLSRFWTWDGAAGALRSSTAGAAPAFWTANEHYAGELSLRVNLGAGRSGTQPKIRAIFGRDPESGAYRYVQVVSGQPGTVTVGQVGRIGNRRGGIIRSTRVNVARRAWHTLGVAFDGRGRITVRLNGREVLTVTARPLAAGQVGFSSLASAVTVDSLDFRTEPDDEPCLQCHAGQASQPLAPDVATYWDGSWWDARQGGAASVQQGGHGDPGGLFAMSCTGGAGCHDQRLPRPGDHRNGALERGALVTQNPMHLRAAFVEERPRDPWDVQMKFDNYCATACHEGYGLTDMRHQGVTAGRPYLLFGFGLTDALARAVPEGVPLDSDLTSAAPPGAPVFGTCVTCHDPHGTGNPDQTGGSNHMVRYRYQSAGELCAICHI